MAGCGNTNWSKDEIANSRKNGILIQQPKLNQTQKENLEALDYLTSIVSLDVEKHKYSLFGDIELKTSVSEKAKRKAGQHEENINPDNEIKREGGTFIHEALYDLMNFHFNNIGDISQIRTKIISGSTKLSIEHFRALSKLAETLTKDIRKQQEQIDPKGKVEIRLEQFVADFLKDIGGKVDVLAVFSDGTVSVYDYKTRTKEGAIGFGEQGKEVVDSLFPYYKLEAYDASMAEYKRILLERIGVKAIRQNRLIPIATKYKYKKEGKIGEMLRPELDILITEQKQNDFLKPIPVGGEASRWEGITKLVDKQMKLQDTLYTKLEKGGLTQDEKIGIQKRIDAINRSIMKTLVDEDIYDLIQTISTLTNEIETRLNELPTLPSGEINPSYVSDIELIDFKNELSTYNDITNETHSYFAEIEESNPEQYLKLKEGLNSVRNDLDDARTNVAFEFVRRSEEEVDKGYKDKNGHLLPLEELSPGQLIFLKISEINNPVFKTVWKIVEEAQYDIKQKFIKMDDEIYSKLDAVHKWASDNKISRLNAFKIMINEKSGNLYSKLDKGFRDKIQNAIADGTDKGLTFIRDSYEFKNKEAFKKEYLSRLEAFKNKEKARYNNFKPTIDINGKVIATAKKQKENYEKAVESWENTFDLINSKRAWLNSTNRYNYLKLKDSVIEENTSAEYKKIKSIKPLHEFYEMWEKYMTEFSDILGIHDYSKLPPNFIPNIRKDVLEHISSDGLHIAAGFKEMMESWKVREEDVYAGTALNEDGLNRKIPILFINKFFAEGENGKVVDNTRKSYELSKSLMLFGHMAYTYEHMNKIEPKINMLKELLGNPTPEQGGIQATDRLGRKIKGKIQPYLTKEGRSTETYQLLEDITDCYLYGIKFKQKSLVPGRDMVHWLTKLKNFNSVSKLAFAIIPSAGAFVAGKIGIRFNAIKNINYTSDQLNEATKMVFTDGKKYKQFIEFFDFPNDSYLERRLQKHISSTKNKLLSSRSAFMPLRGADEHITQPVGIAMAQNYGITKDGGIIRLNVKKRNSEGKLVNRYEPGTYKTILESMKVDENGKVSIEGLSKQGFIQFRAAVKSAVGEVIGNMNADDIGAVDTNFYINQSMAFKSWMPALVQEYTGGLRWDETTQAMRWGRFAAYLSNYAPTMNYTAEELESGKYMYTYMSKVLMPNIRNLILDLTTFGLAPRLGMKRINEVRAQREFYKWQVQNPGLRETVTFDDFLEIKEGQMKAMLVQLRVMFGFIALGLFLGGKGDDDRPRYMDNYATRNLYKIFAKAGSELTFMWNPAEYVRIIKNPVPLTGLLTQFMHTVGNGFDESRDLFVGENRKGDPTPAGYYLQQWMPGAPQLGRFFEIYKNFEKSQYGVYSQQTQ